MRQGCCLAGWEVEVLRGDGDLDRGVNLRSGVKGRESAEHHAHVRGQLRAELAEASEFRVVEELEGRLALLGEPRRELAQALDLPGVFVLEGAELGSHHA